MLGTIIEILKIIIVALNRKNILTGKDNNKINKKFEEIRKANKAYDIVHQKSKKNLDRLKEMSNNIQRTTN